MKFNFKFSNLLGTVYKKGDLVFTKDGNSLISPVGNRITIFDLKSNKSYTLPVESLYNYTTLDLSPNGTTLIAVNENGEAHLISMISKTIIHKHYFRVKVNCLKFSPNGKFFAVSKGNSVYVFRSPGQFSNEYNPFIMERVFHGPYDDVTSIDWSSDSRLIVVGSKDSTAKIYAIRFLENFRYCSLGSHADSVVAVFFEENSLDVNTISRNGRLCIWESSLELNDLTDGEPSMASESSKKRKINEINNGDDIDLSRGEQRSENLEKQAEESHVEEVLEKAEESHKISYKLVAKHYLGNLITEKNVVLKTATYDKTIKILVTGYTNGMFCIHELPNANLIHSLNISEGCISRINLSPNGDWIAAGVETSGQLFVWEWQSETYVLKQQAHSGGITSLTYSPDGMYIVTGGEDGKVKLWNTQSGFCLVTFHEHTSGVTAVKFANNRKFFLSSSLDGSVRAFDISRYRNFRTLTSPKPVQFVSLALDYNCEFVAAGGQDVFEIYLWSMKVGRLLEVISGHEGPVVSLAFNPAQMSTELVSVSWDRTLRVWNAVEKDMQYEIIHLNADALCVTYRPDGNEVAVATLDGEITMYEPKAARQTGTIEGRNDLGSGRNDSDIITAKKSLQAKAFTSICYSADGNYLIAGGHSKNVCIYSVADAILIKKFEVTQNHSLDGVNDFIQRKTLTEFGNLALIDHRMEDYQAIPLPGAKKGDAVSRQLKPEIRVFSIQFSPTGQEFAATTTEGLLIYSADGGEIFDPFQLEEGITPDSIQRAKENKNYAEALMMALRLNEKPLIQEIIESIPYEEIDLIVNQVAQIYALKTLTFIASRLESTRHFQFYLRWIRAILNKHKPSPSDLIMLQKSLTKKYSDLSKICDFNRYTIEFLQKLGFLRKSSANDENNVEPINETSLD